MMHKREPQIIKEFREFHDYVGLLGKHMNQINSRFEKIEQLNRELSNNEVMLAQDILQICYQLEKLKGNIDEIKLGHKKYVMENAVELTKIKGKIVNKNEFRNFKEKLKDSVGETFPPLPVLAQEPTTTEITSHEAYQRVLLPAVTKERVRLKK